jgi:O-acetyl-ADP-ribose deacetylase (regulator of RNase III)
MPLVARGISLVATCPELVCQRREVVTPPAVSEEAGGAPVLVAYHFKHDLERLKKRFPKAVEKYEAVCKLKAFDVGNVLVCTEEGESPKYVIHFPTKEHWKRPSRTLYIDSGLLALWRAIDHHKIRSIAIPALGCGLGGLKWENVRFLIVEYLKGVDGLTVYLYPPKEQS